MYEINVISRGTDFLFQKIAFSVSKNLQFRFNMLEKWKFRFPIEIVHTKYWKFHLHRDVCYKYTRIRGRVAWKYIYLVCDIL